MSVRPIRSAQQHGRSLYPCLTQKVYAECPHPTLPASQKRVPLHHQVRTAFNILGPVLNPARAAYALVGVYDPAISGLMADVLLRTGVSKALVVHSCGLDELTPMGSADIVEVRRQG